MGEYRAVVSWQRAGARFTDNRYSRTHSWEFDGGAVVPASASPAVVPVPLSDPAAVDPEEAFVAALSSCHMMWFLSIAAKQGLVVDRYRDTAVGYLERNDRGRRAITRVVLRPEIEFAGSPAPSPSVVKAIHDRAHHECFIANSVHTVVAIE